MYSTYTIPPTAFTDRFLKSLDPKEGQRIRVFDAGAAGLFLLAGARSKVFHAKVGSKSYKIGQYPGWTIAEARQRLLEIRRTLEEGGDPAVRTGENLPTFEEAFSQYELARLTKRAAQTGRDYRRMMEAYAFPKFGKVRVDRVTKAEVSSLHGEITAAGKAIRANRVMAVISSVFGWLSEVGLYLGPNPCAKLERNREEGRETFLSPEQIGAVLRALDEYAGRTKGNDVAADCIKFCLATGCRSGEAKAARWSDFDSDLVIWTKAASTTKQRKVHRVPLGPAATDILLARKAKAAKGDTFVFGGKYGAEHLRQLRSVWAFVRKRTGLKEVRVHDTRHSFASLAVSAGVPLKVVGGLLGHSSVQTTNRYAHLYDEDLKSAAEAVNARIAGKVPK